MSKKTKKKAVKVVNAPYVETDINQLGDKCLNHAEFYAHHKEQALNQAGAARIWGQAELEDPERSAGARLPYTEILRRLWELNSTIKVKDGIEGNVAIYVRKRVDEYDEEERDRSKDEFFWHHKYVTGMPKEALPEYAHVLLDNSHLATKEVRGWRSVLIALVKSRAITYRQAIQAFGDPSGDQRSLRWFDNLQSYIN